MRERGAEGATTQIGRMGAEDPSRISGRDREITIGGLGGSVGIARSLCGYSQTEALEREVGVLEARPGVEDLIHPRAMRFMTSSFFSSRVRKPGPEPSIASIA